jgi:maltose/moltooligosaccharide transporter
MFSTASSTGGIPPSVKFAFYTGGAIFLVAVLYTVFTSKEYPPADINFKQKLKEKKKAASLKLCMPLRICHQK